MNDQSSTFLLGSMDELQRKILESLDKSQRRFNSCLAALRGDRRAVDDLRPA